MTDDDLIRRGDALRVADEVFDQCENVHGDDRGAFAAAEVGARIAALPAVSLDRDEWKARAERLETALRLLHDNVVLAFPALASLGPVANARAALTTEERK